MEKSGIWSEYLNVSASHVNTFREATLVSICNRLQEVAGNHAAFRELGYHDMSEQGLFWALARMKIWIEKYPMWTDIVQIQTWVQSMQGPFSHRNFQLMDVAGNSIGSASTLWTALDVNLRKLVTIDASHFPIFPDKIVPSGTPDKIRFKGIKQNPSIITIQYSDLDMINHVNNVKYIEHLLNTCDWSDKKSGPGKLEINYLGEAFLGDTLHIYSQLNEFDTSYSIVCPERKMEIVRARIGW